ncbi:DNA replication and repair protein RecO [Proteiniborus ethanoligenes]|uniref:DNA repair protein RecO n=1 Tax=Proteiniborus ethanoligenes TaxID=415015 RepID=A0A1H3R2N8_9FIRM|nr:DNA repair protein RecO [Proteiniborus ethanoligenes]TAH63320.1 MAG: DNA repair protein RecO [Gottschalkiaceae bacterium]SDZ20092.1 DNA replication and repair protein RecO [Proteiniborus ethanoligenes]
MLFKTEGLVLRQTKYDEWDKILTIFTRNNGKVQAIAKGARRPKGSLVASTQVFSHSDFLLYQGRSLYHVNQADIINSFFSLRDDLYKLAYGTYIIELVDAASIEGVENTKLFDLSIKTLKVLSGLDKDYKKLLAAFELKYITFIGYRPQISRCVLCNGELGNIIKFSSQQGGAICQSCFQDGIGGATVSKDILIKMKELLFVHLDKINDLKMSIKDIDIIEKLISNYIMNHIEKNNFKSLEFLKTLE